MQFDSRPTVIKVSNLPTDATDMLLYTLFQSFGQILSCHIMQDPTSMSLDLACFIQFASFDQANMALLSMNNIRVYDRELRISWTVNQQSATNPYVNMVSTQESKKAIFIYVGDLADVVTDRILIDTFQQFGPVLEAKVVRNPDGESRGYGFVGFEKEDDAKTAIMKMDRSWLISKPIRVNWATRKVDTAGGFDPSMCQGSKSFEEVITETPETNTTVYCGGIQFGLTDELIKSNFMEFGHIQDVKLYPDKGFAFIKFSNHEAAAKAIAFKNGSKINNYLVKCSWGKQQPVAIPGTFPTMNNFATPAAYYAACDYNQLQGHTAKTENVAPTVPQQQYDPQLYQQYYAQYYSQYYQNYAAQNGNSAITPSDLPKPPGL